MQPFLCAALIFAICVPTFGQVVNNNQPSANVDKNAGQNGGPAPPAPPAGPTQPVGPAPPVGPTQPVGPAPPPIPPALPPVAKLPPPPPKPKGNSSSVDNCRCFNTSDDEDGDSRCIAYSKRWQANTIDEAIENFRSPIESDSLSSKSSAMTNEEKNRVTAFFKQNEDQTKGSAEATEPEDDCRKDDKCVACMSGVYYLLSVRAAYTGINQYSWTNQYRDAIKKLYKDSGVPFPLIRDKCKQSKDKVMSYQAILNVYNQVLSTLSCKACMDQYSPTPPTGSVNADGRRTKRATVGTTIQVRCDYRRGTLVGDGTSYVGMCNLCWTVRQLPAEYAPRLLNEVTCSTDTTCLAGYGQCRARYRATNVMYQSYYEMSINAQTGCECQVVSGSAFFPYVNA